jgi:uncharacterized protein YprB with RNaseH-like and TPR domain
MSSPRILTYDIECTDLNSDWGVLLCVGYKWLGDKDPTVISILDYPGKDFLDDSNLVKAFHQVISKADMVITYFGKGFDEPWMKGKYMLYDVPALANVPHIDLFYTAKSNTRLSRKSLDNLVTEFRVGKKYNVSRRNWRLAKIGDPAGIKEVMKHCFVDVNLTEKLYLTKLRPYVRQHPRIAGWLPCRHCGSTRLQSRGLALYVTKNSRTRVQCQSCGGWDTRSNQHLEESGIA